MNNPIRYTDPFGLAPQQGRQIGVKDYYFDRSGHYLGEDNRPSNRIRIIDRRQWERLSEQDLLDENGMVDHELAKHSSVLFSQASFGFGACMSNTAILSVYQWVNNKFNITNMPMSINNTEMDAFMRTGVEHSKSIVFNSFFEINHNRMAQYKFCDNIYDIASIMRHEAGHDFTWRNDPYTHGMTLSQKELAAYEYQMYGNSIWGMTSPQLQTITMSMYVYYSLVSASNWPRKKN